MRRMRSERRGRQRRGRCNPCIAGAGAALVAALLAAGCSSGSDDDPGASQGSPEDAAAASSIPEPSAPPSTVPPTTVPPTTTTTTIPPGQLDLEALAESLTPRQKAMQLLIVSSWGAEPILAIAEALGSDCVGGVFVAKGFRHWDPPEDPDAASEAIAAISEAVSDCAAPAFIASDAEPGTATLKLPVEPLAAPAVLVAQHSQDPAGAAEDLAERAEAFAASLRGLGIHVNFGVVADVDAGADHYMAQSGRTFGSDPAAVTALSEAIVAGHCRSGVASTLKHFPNQGATVEDPHELDSYSTNDPAGWERLGRVPYASVDAPLVMTGHVRYRSVDGATPASLSSEITTGWLRDDLGYDGVIVTDDLFTMRGAGSELGVAERGVAAILAGNDMALYLEVDEVVEAVDELARLIEGGGPIARRLEASVRRVLELKAALGLLDGIEAAWFPLCGAERLRAAPAQAAPEPEGARPP